VCPIVTVDDALAPGRKKRVFQRDVFYAIVRAGNSVDVDDLQRACERYVNPRRSLSAWEIVEQSVGRCHHRGCPAAPGESQRKIANDVADAAHLAVRQRTILRGQ